MSERELSAHFAFGDNWASYAGLIDAHRVAAAEEGVARLVGDVLPGASFLDVGCGSGLSALAAARLGAGRVVAVDLDPQSVATARRLFGDFGVDPVCRAEVCSVFDLAPDLGRFDIVYSWGVLHHTGAMEEAIAKAASFVAPGGLFAFALYHRTALCGFWKREKRWYAKASPGGQRMARAIYRAVHGLSFMARGADFDAFVRDYRDGRGMNYEHDVHDWLGGYPYESISVEDVETMMGRLHFAPVRVFATPPGTGWLGSRCDEFVYRRERD